MLYFNKQPASRPMKNWSSLLNPETGEPAEGNFPRLGEIPISREKTLIEELFSFDGPPDATVSVGGQEYYYFSGEGYLGLQANPEVLAATCEAVLRYGTSLGTIRRRYTPAPIFEVEGQTAEIYKTDRACYLADESSAAERLLGSIAEKFDAVLIDELTSDSIFNACERIFADRNITPVQFRHRDADHLADLMKKHSSSEGRTLAVTDGVFNVTGTVAPIPDYYSILAEYPGSGLFLDDSDALGIIGEKGRGTLEYFDYNYSEVNRTRLDGAGDPTEGMDYWTISEPTDFDPARTAHHARKRQIRPEEFEVNPYDEQFSDVQSDDFLYLEPEKLKKAEKKPLPVQTYLTASLSRAVGGFGAVIPGSERFIDRLKDSRPNQPAGLLPPTPLAAATYKGLQLSFYHDMIRHRLWNNVYYFKTEIEKLGLSAEPTMVPIISIQTGSDGNMRRIQRELIAEQMLVSFLQQMNARRREGSLRVALFATHERAMLDLLLEVLQNAL